MMKSLPALVGITIFASVFTCLGLLLGGFQQVKQGMSEDGHQLQGFQEQDSGVNVKQMYQGTQWQYQADRRVHNNHFQVRSRRISDGIFDEDEIQLLWNREDGKTLIYLVSWGHAGYAGIEIQLRSDEQAIWLVGQSRNQEQQVTSSLDLVSGEFQNEGTFNFLIAENLWTALHEKDGIIKQERLTWVQSSETGVQRLYDSYLGLAEKSQGS